MAERDPSADDSVLIVASDLSDNRFVLVSAALLPLAKEWHEFVITHRRSCDYHSFDGGKDISFSQRPDPSSN